MAEFCKECFKEYISTTPDNINDEELVLSSKEDFCEGCLEYKYIVLHTNK